MKFSPTLLVIALSCCSSSPPPEQVPQRKPVMNAENGSEQSARPLRPAPVLVELFTSQGCSSCPPADELLGVIDQLTDVDVVALSFHVDYWNGLGWRDPYSSKAATARQRAYASRLPHGRSYTPQLVVNGRTHTVGSHKRAAIRAIESAAARPPGDVHLQAEIVASTASEVSVKLALTLALDEPRPLLYVALFESALVTTIRRGENKGLTMRNDYVVRRFERVDPDQPSLNLRLDASWQADELGIVAFAQDPESLAIVAVSVPRW